MVRKKRIYLYAVCEIEPGNIQIPIVEKDFFEKNGHLNGSPDDFYYDFLEDSLPNFPELSEGVLEPPVVFNGVDAIKDYLKDIPQMEYSEELEELYND